MRKNKFDVLLSVLFFYLMATDCNKRSKDLIEKHSLVVLIPVDNKNLSARQTLNEIHDAECVRVYNKSTVKADGCVSDTSILLVLYLISRGFFYFLDFLFYSVCTI